MISSKWTDHLKSAEDKQEFREMVRTSAPVLERLASLLQKELDAIESKIDSQEFLAQPGTTERLIANLAQRRKLKEVIKLTEV